jgi:undecaprenyl-diphosphatase
MDGFFKLITWAGSLLALLPICGGAALLLVRWQRGAEAVLLLGGLLGASLITHILKLLVARPRPIPENSLVTMPADFSFPSAHTAQVFACGLASVLVVGRHATGFELGMAWAVMLLLATAVGYSRIYLQVHFPSDVVAGAFLGVIWVLLLDRFLRAYR